MFEKPLYYPGEIVNGEVVYELDKEIKVRNILINIACGEHTVIHVRRRSGRHTHTYTYTEFYPFVTHQIVAAGEGAVAAGVHRYPFSFPLPQNALPSYQGVHARVTYEVTTKADIPWGFDVEGGAAFRVGVPPQLVSRPAMPKFFVSPNTANMGMGGMQAPFLRSTDDKPCFKVDIFNDLVIAGQALQGTVTVANLNPKLRAVQLKLVPIENARARGYSETAYLTPVLVEIPASALRDNTPINFQIPVPPQTFSTYIGGISSLSWRLECNLDLSWSIDVSAMTDIIVVNCN
ncbi:MAG: hypothetical protein QW728_05580 [Thermoplasmata archaeon]